jgi:hypothetical protein
MESENITLTETPVAETPVAAAAATPSQVRLVDVEVASQDIALNLMVSFLNTAQSRGVFNLEESAKIWECVSKFIISKP